LSNQIAFVYQGSIWLGKLDDTKSIHLLTTDLFSLTEIAVQNSLFWSPNEKYLAALYNGTVNVYSLADGADISLKHNLSQGHIAAFAWSSDSQSITVVDYSDSISHWPVG
jgi:WD40 repeat protein